MTDFLNDDEEHRYQALNRTRAIPLVVVITKGLSHHHHLDESGLGLHCLDISLKMGGVNDTTWLIMTM